MSGQPDVGRALAEASARLHAGGISGAARDALILLADLLAVPRHVLGPPWDHPELLAQLAARPGWQAAFTARIDARASRVPVSRIIGRRAFWSSEFIVTPDVLDPRPETETLVAAALEQRFSRLLDLGTGSGCILVSLLRERPAARGLGADLSAPALAVAHDNIAAAGLQGRAELVLSDWFAAVQGRFDMIVSNPPYIAAREMPGLMPEVRGHDPVQALTDGADGLSAYRAITARAGAHLTPGGWLMVEIGPTQGRDVAALFARAGLQRIAVLPDLDGRDRVVQGCSG